MEILKKYKLTFILFVLTTFLAIFYISLPAKNKIKKIEVKKIEKNIRLIDIQAYYISENSLKSYVFTTEENSYSNLIIATVRDILEKSNENSQKINLQNTYFSDDTIYFEFDNKNLSPILKEAIKRTTTELLGINNINFI